MADRDWSQFRADSSPPDARSIVAPRLMGAPANLPPRIDLRGDLGPVDQQGNVASCAASAVAGAMECVLRKRGGADLQLSRLFIYYNGRRMAGRENIDGGMSTGHALASLLGHGACEERLWPFHAGAVTQRPSQACYDQAMMFYDVQYAQVLRGDPARQALANGWPVIFRYFGPREMLDAAGRTGRMDTWGDKPAATPGFGHTMLAVGYDDVARTILVRNSWGEGFGERGYFHMPYDTLEATTFDWEFWTIAPTVLATGVATTPAGAGGAMQLMGATLRESVEHTQRNAAAQTVEALASLGKDLRKELQDDLDDAKRSIRNRLRGLNDDR